MGYFIIFVMGFREYYGNRVKRIKGWKVVLWNIVFGIWYGCCVYEFIIVVVIKD